MSDTEAPERFIRLGENDVYGYTDLLATRRDATVIDGYTAAQLLRQQGIENELTARYPNTAALNPLPQPEFTPAEEQAVYRAKVKKTQDDREAAKQATRQRAADFAEQQKPGIPETSTEAVEEPGVPEAAGVPIGNAIRDLLGDVTNRT